MKKLLLLLPLLAMIGCRQPNPEPISLNGNAQGTFYSIIYFDSLNRNLQPQIDSILDAFDMSCSLWKENSLLRRVNRGETDSLDYVLQSLFQYARIMHEYTDGAFDCAMGELIRAWGFAFDSLSEMTPEVIDALMANAERSRQFRVSIDASDKANPRFSLQHLEGSEYNFNAVAQGAAVDLLSQYLLSQGIESHLINLGGEVIAHGLKPDGKAWIVGIERPAKAKDSNPQVELAIRLENRSVVTSGSYRKYYEKDGTRISHTIDPTTGRPVTHTLLSASVVSDESWYADAMATAFMVMGLERSLEFIASHSYDPNIQAALFIYDSCGTYKTYSTPAFDSLVVDL